MLKVVINGKTWCSNAYWRIFPQEFPVPDCYPPRSIDSDYILVELAYLNDLARFVPLRGVRASLVLYSHEVANDEGW